MSTLPPTSSKVLWLLVASVGCAEQRRIVSVSDLGAGMPLPIAEALAIPPSKVQTAAGTAGSARQPCRIIVYFEPDCPHCAAAANRDIRASTQGFPVIWITQADSASLSPFRSKLDGPLEIQSVPNARRLLKVRAVPVGFFVDGSNEIRVIFPHAGGVESRLLRPYCPDDA